MGRVYCTTGRQGLWGGVVETETHWHVIGSCHVGCTTLKDLLELHDDIQ